ncbi:MAG TPA: NAD(P)H-dependent oxidoreductase [Bryobacteraceae bacterium]|jgi:NAD(P)H-dependent FMN reductase|nr:NAD(P)H-dependent oxidoreductase [Bryobacteraceae bacterium]HXR77437.1 NAD(P)H-dependent oxidoreductase [Bryobacteraceae bacterium]
MPFLKQEAPLDSLKIRVVGISGSLRKDSLTTSALRTALLGSAEAGAATELIDLREYDLIFAGGENHRLAAPGVARLKQQVKQAHGILLGTPEYHGSFSGVLKNALDLMGFDEFEGKMIGLIGVSAGRLGAFDALNSLRSVGRALHAWVVPEQVSIPEAWRCFDDAGRLRDSKLAERLHHVGRRVAEFAWLHECGRAREFVEFWESAMENPGG